MTGGDRVRTFISNADGTGSWLYGTVKREPPNPGSISLWNIGVLCVWVKWDQERESYELTKYLYRVSALEELADAAEC